MPHGVWLGAYCQRTVVKAPDTEGKVRGSSMHALRTTPLSSNQEAGGCLQSEDYLFLLAMDGSGNALHP